MREHSTTRRALIKAGAALGTVAALAVPVAILPKAEAGEHPDAALLAMGCRLEALWARENELVAEEKRLVDLAEQIRPAPAPELLAYERDGRRLLEQRKGGFYWPRLDVLDEVKDIERCWRVLGFREGPCHEGDVLAALERWRAGGKEARRITGAEAADAEFQRVTAEAGDLCVDIIEAPAKTIAGLMVKMRALEWCYAGESYTAALQEMAEDENSNTSECLVASALHDALVILSTGGSANV